MKKIVLSILFLGFISCQNKEVLLPELNTTIIENVNNHSLVYFFFETKKNDTLIDVNRNNTISSTNWIFNIDKRLPLKLVIPEIVKLQAKKENSIHKDSTSQNYFSYSNRIKRQLAFYNFTNVKYILKEPKFGTTVYFKKNNVVKVDMLTMSKDKIVHYLQNMPSDKPVKLLFCFDKNLKFDEYLSYKIFLDNQKIKSDAKDYIY